MKVLSWELSITIDQYFVTHAPEGARECCGDLQIFNTDQGAHLPARFLSIL